MTSPQLTGADRPEVADPPPWSFPLPQHHRLSNGIPVVLHHLPGQHVISTTVLIDHSLANEPAEHEGITAMAARLLTEGTQAHPGERFAELLDNNGAAMGHQLSTDGLQILMDVPTTNLAPALDLVAEAVLGPELSPGDVNRHKELRLAEIAQLEAHSAGLASREFRRRVLSNTDRAGRPNGGDRDQVASLTPELVRDWADSLLRPEHTTIVIGGDLGATEADRDDLLALLEARFGTWTGPHAPITHPDLHPGRPGCTVIDRPGAVQADLRIGGWGIDRSDPRWPGIRVASHAVGGGFNSRLNTVLREEKGFTYGIRLGFTPQRSGGWFTTSGSFRTEVVGEAMSLAREILAAPDDITAAEVVDAQRYLTGITALQYATADAVVDQTSLQLMMGLPDDYLTRAQEALVAVDADAATTAYREIVDPDRLTCVIVGDAEALVPQLADAGFDPQVA